MADNEQPNRNICIVEKIENAAMMMAFWINKLNPETTEQIDWKDMCQKDVKEMQDGNLFGLRKAYENGQTQEPEKS